MGGVLGTDPQPSWNKPRSNIAKPDQADTSDSPTVNELRAKRGGQRLLKDVRVNAEVRQDAAVDDTLARIFNLMYDLPTFQRPSASLFIGARSR